MKHLSKEIYRLCETKPEEVFDSKSRPRRAQEAMAILAYCLKVLNFDTETIARMLNMKQAAIYAAIKRTENYKEIRDSRTIAILARLNHLFGYGF